MHKAVLLTLIALAAIGVQQAAAQQTDSFAEPVAPRNSYTFDPVHAVMSTTPSASFVIPGRPVPDPAATTASTTYTGTAYVTFTVKLISNLPAGAVVRCGGNVGLEYLSVDQVTPITGLGNIVNLSSSETVAATLSNGTATCQLTVPYSWTVPASTAKTTIALRGVTGSIGISATMAEATGNVNTVVTLRSTTTSLTGPATPPADGGTIVLRASSVL